MRTFVYVDGLNLYYGTLKGTPFKWLDPVALLERILQPHHDIVKLKYFTARVSGTPADQECRGRPRTSRSPSVRTFICARSSATGPRSRCISGIS